MKWLTWLLAAAFLVAGCTLGSGKPVPMPQTPAEVQQALGARAAGVLAALKAHDMAKLGALVHPDKGVRFSPYAHVDTNKDVVLTAAQMRTAWSSTQQSTWGAYDGSGNPIQLTFQEYFGKFVYDKEFAAAPQVGWGQTIGHGNTPDNIGQAYPQGVMVEYHFPGFDPKYQGMDWESLRLVFERKGKTWYLVGIVHAQWTI